MKPNSLKITKRVLLVVSIALISFGCSSDKTNNGEGKESASNTAPAAETFPEYGVGPVEHVALSADIDQAMVEKGKAIFEGKCTVCHQFDERYVGPALAGVTERRNPAWIMNMIINPGEMLQKDPIAKKLLAEYLSQMANQNVAEDEARAILEYFRSVDKKQ